MSVWFEDDGLNESQPAGSIPDFAPESDLRTMCSHLGVPRVRCGSDQLAPRLRSVLLRDSSQARTQHVPVPRGVHLRMRRAVGGRTPTNRPRHLLVCEACGASHVCRLDAQCSKRAIRENRGGVAEALKFVGRVMHGKAAARPLAQPSAGTPRRSTAAVDQAASMALRRSLTARSFGLQQA